MFREFKNKDFSIFYDQKTKSANENAEIDFIYNKEIDSYFIKTDIDNINAKKIKNHFKFIRISPNDKVFVKGKKIPNKFFNSKTSLCLWNQILSKPNKQAQATNTKQPRYMYKQQPSGLFSRLKSHLQLNNPHQPKL